MTIPDALGVARIALALPIAAELVLRRPSDPSVLPLTLFLVATATDVLDGALARRSRSSGAGAALDPAADKVLVYAVLAPSAIWIPPLVVPLVVLLVRDAFVTWLRARGGPMPASRLAKLKTALLFAGCAGLLLMRAAWVYLAAAAAFGLIAAGTVAAVLSAVHYAVSPRRASA